MNIQPSDATLGVLVTNVDLGKLCDATFQQIDDLWHQHAILVFSDQYLSDEQHLDFTSRFGRLEKGLRQASPAGLGRITNVKRDGSVAESDSLQNRFNSGNSGWHSDSSYKRVSAKASILAAHQVPSEGGETEWADMRAAYDELDEQMKAWLDDKIAVHSYVFSHAPHGGLEILNDEELSPRHPLSTGWSGLNG